MTEFNNSSLIKTNALLKSYRNYAQSIYNQLPTTKDDKRHLIDANLRYVCEETRILHDNVFIGDITDFTLRFPAQAQKYLYATKKQWNKRKVSAFIECSWNKSLIVYVPERVRVLEPIDIVFHETDPVVIKKIVIILEKDAHATIYNRLFNGQTILCSIDCFIEQNAQLSCTYDRSKEIDVQEINRVSFYLNKNAYLDLSMLISGSRYHTMLLDILLEGEHAHADVRGAYVINGNQQVDIITNQLHCAPSTRSKVIMKGVLDDSAHAMYRGLININQQAEKSHASQENKNMLLSNSARAFSIPSLEVLTHDVQCAHGSAVGQCDDEQLFYLQSRGLSSKAARKLLIESFFARMFEKGSILNALYAVISQKLFDE